MAFFCSHKGDFGGLVTLLYSYSISLEHFGKENF